MATHLDYSITYDSLVYQISKENITKIGILSGLLDAGITDLELPQITATNETRDSVNDFIHDFLNYITKTLLNEPGKSLDIFPFIFSPLEPSILNLGEYIINIQSGNYDDNQIRMINYRAIRLLQVADYWDFGAVIDQISEYMRQFIKICDMDTINRWLGGII